jgi:L-alanine-DL-glutamate epimerase-like enolase superfamily enzyme
MAIKNNSYYESLVKDNPYITLDRGIVKVVNGVIHAPEGPGIGFEVQWAQTGAPKGLEKYLK